MSVFIVTVKNPRNANHVDWMFDNYEEAKAAYDAALLQPGSGASLCEDDIATIEEFKHWLHTGAYLK